MAIYHKNYQQKYVDNIGNEIFLYPKTRKELVEGLDYDAAIEALRSNIAAVQVSLPAANWSNQAPYTQTIVIDGMTADWNPSSPDLMPGETVEQDDAIQEAAACLSKIRSENGLLVFTCNHDKPESDFTVYVPGRL